MTEAPPQTFVSRYSSDLRQLRPGDVGSLRLPWDGRFSYRDLEQIAGSTPNLSVWNRRTGEFLIGGRWRHREEIATIVELAATGGAIDLIDAWGELCGSLGIRLLIASEQAERRKEQFYTSASFDPIEDIVIYELARVRAQPPALGGLRFERFSSADAEQFKELLELDHAAFPWLWWNSRDEFLQYYAAPGVEIYLGRDETHRVVTYVGITCYRSWGHLDRIAVLPGLQGRGVGRAALDFAVMTLARSGAKRVGLSTQAENYRSRRLYESYGFRRSAANDYRLYGRWLVQPEERYAVAGSGEGSSRDG